MEVPAAGSEDQMAGKDHRERSDTMDGPLATEIEIRNPNGDWITITNPAHIEHMSETLDLDMVYALGVTYCAICAMLSNSVTIIDDRAMVYRFHHWAGGGCWDSPICPACEKEFDEDDLSIQCQGDDEDFPSCKTDCICSCQMLDCQAAVNAGTYVVKPSSW